MFDVKTISNSTLNGRGLLGQYKNKRNSNDADAKYVLKKKLGKIRKVSISPRIGKIFLHIEKLFLGFQYETKNFSNKLYDL